MEPLSYRTTKPLCPLCGNRIYWTCRGKTGYAHCSKSIYARRKSDDKMLCNWKGKVVRENNQIYFIVDERG